MRQKRFPRDALPSRQQLLRFWRIDDSRQRLVIVVVSLAILVAIALPLYGYYRDNIASARVVVTKVGDTELDLAYLLKLSKSEARVAILGGAVASSNIESIQSIPLMVLDELEASLVVRKKGSEIGIEVTPVEVDLALREFILGPPSEEGEPPSDEAFRQSLEAYLEATEATQRDVRKRIEDIVYVDKAQDLVGQQVPLVQEQVHLWVIGTQSENQMSVVLARLRAGENFIELAKEYGTAPDELTLIGPSLNVSPGTGTVGDENMEDSTAIPDQQDSGATDGIGRGELGWIPRGMLTNIDDVIFGLQPGEVSEVIDGTAIYFVEERESARPVEEMFLNLLRRQHFQEWFQEQRKAVGVERCFELPFADGNADCSWQYEWLLERLF